MDTQTEKTNLLDILSEIASETQNTTCLYSEIFIE